MVRRIITFFKADSYGLHGAAYLLALSALLSQILALIRDRLLAHNFGAGAQLDIYYAAFRVQDFLFLSVASLVSLAVLIPILSSKIDLGKEETRKFLSSIFSFFFFLISAVIVVVWFLTPEIVKVIFPGLLGKGFDQDLIFLTRILLLSPLILGFSNLLSSVTQAYGKFFIYALSPILYNIGIILGIIFFYPYFGLRGLGFGVILGAIFHLSIQIPFVFKQGIFPTLTLSLNFEEIKKVVYISLPRTLTLSLNHIALLFLVGLASFLEEGSISILAFSFNLQSVPVSIIGASYSVAAFPVLVRHFIKKEEKEFNLYIRTAIKHIIFWSFPAIVLFIVLRAQIVRVILGTGEFSWADTRLTAACLALFALSLVAQNLSLLFTRAFYAAGETKKPLFISLFSSVTIVLSAYAFLNLFSNNLFFKNFIEALLRVSGLNGTEILMLPLAYTIGSLINLLLFMVLFRRFLPAFSIGNTAFHSFSASVLMGSVTYVFLEFLGRFLNLDTFIGIFLQGIISGVVGILSGILMLLILKNEEFVEITKSFRKKLLKTDIVQTE